MTGRLAALGLVLVLGGCASLAPERTPESAAVTGPVTVRIDAPPALQRLLEQHLDLARLARDARDETLSEIELRRLQAATPAEARALLATEGYMDAEVRTEREPGAPPRVVVHVTPGPRTLIGGVELKVSGALAEAAERGDATARATLAQWRRDWPLRAGQPFSNTVWRDAKNSAIARLRSAGYAMATWFETAADVDADTARAQLALHAATGPLFRTGALVVEGLEQHDERSVINLAGFEPGTPASETLLLDYQERLQRSGLFERAAVTLDVESADAGRATVLVRVREAPLQQATLGAGFSDNGGARVLLEHLHRRPFGERATLRNKLEWGAKRSAWGGELASHAQPGLYRGLIGGAAERLESDTDTVTSVRARLGRSYDTPRIERFWFGEVERVRSRPVPAASTTRSDVVAGTLNFHGVWRNLDSVVLPTRGRSIALQTGLGRVHELDDSGRPGTGGGAFARALLRAQWWRPFGDHWYAQARIELGQVFAGDTVNVPETQRFRAGGDDSVRGYAWRSLTPQVAGVDVGGRVIGTASVEIARPVSERLANLWWAAFVDAGNAAERWGDFKPAWGAGVGARWRSPVGPLRADLAYGEQVRRWRLHLSIGIAF